MELMLQVVWPDGKQARFHGGEAIELNLRKAIREALLARRRVGVLTASAINDAVTEAFEGFKAQVLPSRLEM